MGNIRDSAEGSGPRDGPRLGMATGIPAKGAERESASELFIIKQHTTVQILYIPNLFTLTVTL